MKGNGIALAITGSGVLFLIAGIKGYSVLAIVQDIVTGKNPKTAVANQFNTGAADASGINQANIGAGITPASGNEKDVIDAILQGLGATINANTEASLSAWIQRETPWPPVARYNPMNTTLPAPGATDYNSDHVKNYTSWSQGIAATVATLEGGYPHIVRALISGKGLIGNSDPAVAAEFYKWSDGGYSSI